MKKVVVVLLLFYVKAVTAQPFTIGLTAGGIDYNYRQLSAFRGIPYYAFGLCGQYIFKDSSAWGIEANFDSYPSGINNNTGLWDPYNGFASAEYVCFNPFHKYKGVIIQLKAGLFYASYDASSRLPLPDYGPAIGIYLGIFKLSKKSYVGLDVDNMWGLQNYLIHDYTNTLTGNSNINYLTFTLKYIHKI